MTAMPLLIDGHNLIGQLPDLSLSDPNDEAKLVARLRAYVARTGRPVTVVFDPAPGSDIPSFGHHKDREGRLEVIYAAPGHKADDVIREIVGQAKDRRGLIVVTADGALAQFTRQCGVRVQPPAEFARSLQQTLRVTANADEKPDAGRAEVEAWAGVFKEPAPLPKPPPSTPSLTAQERKRRRRMEQLKKQVRGGGMLR